MTIPGDALLQAEARQKDAYDAYVAAKDAARLEVEKANEEADRVKRRIPLRDLLLHILADFRSPGGKGWQIHRLGPYAGDKGAPEGWPAVRKALDALVAGSPVLHWDGHEYIVRRVVRDGRYEWFTAEKTS